MRETRAPWMHSGVKTDRYVWDVEIALLALLVFSCFAYGLRPALMVLFSVSSALFCELVGNAVRHQRPTVFDGSAMVTGTMIGLMMSPMTPYWVPVLASAFAIVVVKIPFGGFGRNVFNPAAAGMALATQCFPTRVFTYPDVTANGKLPLWTLPETLVTKNSPAADLAAGAASDFTFADVMWGELCGPIGATALFVLLAAAAFLFLRRTTSPYITLPYLVVCMLIAAIFPRSTGGVLYNIALEISSGYLLFTGIFLLNDPVTSPRYNPARIVYGVIAAIMVMLLRHTGRFEEGACFAVLLMNAGAPLIDRGCWHFWHWYRERVAKGGRAV